ncbi:MAG TPA: hypothetical protein DEO43_05470 [Halieaceae bacterium]|jgi:hypothetical protein|nr:hypothetical protein [Halieaceae bacterium]
MRIYAQLYLLTLNLIFSAGLTHAQPLSPPQQVFNHSEYKTTLDYTDNRLWLALPDKYTPAQLNPGNVLDQSPTSSPTVDVFYVHPTTYLSNASWIDPLDNHSATHENKHWVLAYQASVFNKCCRIFAPIYRQASIYTYLEPNEMLRAEIFDIPYQDVLAAFRNFANSRSPAAPFILASHSQGTHHLLRLLAEEIDGSPLQDRLVVAYILGATVRPVTPEYRSKLKTLKVCTKADDTACFVHWDTVADGARAMMPPSQSVCVNPLSWREDRALRAAHDHRGALPVTHNFIRDFGPTDVPRGDKITNLEKLEVSLTKAQCVDGILRVDRLPEDYAKGLTINGNYHILDFSLFYGDIQQNAEDRIAVYKKNLSLSVRNP